MYRCCDFCIYSVLLYTDSKDWEVSAAQTLRHLYRGGRNLIDRIRFGYVVDFFYFRLIDFPVFNVADIYVTVSFAVLLLLVFFQYKEEDLEFFGKKKGTSADGE